MKTTDYTGDVRQKEAMPVGLYHLSYYLPPKLLSVDELAKKMNFSAEKRKLYKGAHGLRVIHIAENETVVDMAVKAAKKALDESGVYPMEIDVVILYHTMYLTSLEPNSLVGRIQHQLGLKRAVGFSVWEQYCASNVNAIRVARSMILSGSAQTVLLVGADCFFGSSIREIEGITLQGEGGSAVIVKGNCESNRLIAITSYTDGTFYRGVHCSPEEFDRFNLIYFLTTTRVIQRTLKQAGLTLDDISLIIPHNINLSSWARILTILKCDERKFFGDNIPRHGHVFGTDMVMNLVDAVNLGRIQKGDYVLLATAGMGAGWGCAIIRH